MKKSQIELAKELESAVAGLWYMSETDAEIFPFTGSKSAVVSADEIRRQIGVDDATLIEEREFDEFFARLVTEREWHGPEELAIIRRFQILAKVLSLNLMDLKVFKVGEIQRGIYIVGLTNDGFLTGIKTFAVET